MKESRVIEFQVISILREPDATRSDGPVLSAMSCIVVHAFDCSASRSSSRSTPRFDRHGWRAALRAPDGNRWTVRHPAADNGPEVLGTMFVDWCETKGLLIERFNRSLRNELLDLQYLFHNLRQVRELVGPMQRAPAADAWVVCRPPSMKNASRRSLSSTCLLGREAYVGSAVPRDRIFSDFPKPFRHGLFCGLFYPSCEHDATC